jgi:hypothetical protein
MVSRFEQDYTPDVMPTHEQMLLTPEVTERIEQFTEMFAALVEAGGTGERPEFLIRSYETEQGHAERRAFLASISELFGVDVDSRLNTSYDAWADKSGFRYNIEPWQKEKLGLHGSDEATLVDDAVNMAAVVYVDDRNVAYVVREVGIPVNATDESGGQTDRQQMRFFDVHAERFDYTQTIVYKEA